MRTFLRAVFAGYPDRVARRREPGSPRFLLASGHGAVLGRDSGVRDAAFLVAVDVQSAPASAKATARRRLPSDAREATIRMASAIDPAWLDADGHPASSTRIESGRVRAVERTYYGAIAIGERPATPDPEKRRGCSPRPIARAGWSDADDAARAAACVSPRSARRTSPALAAAPPRPDGAAIDEIDLRGALDWTRGAAISIAARRRRLAVPSGRTDAAHLPGRRHRRGRREAAGTVRPRRIAAARRRGGSRSSSSCSRRTAVRCRRRAISAASGIRRIRKCARNCAAAIRAIPGPKIPGPPHRPPREPNPGVRSKNLPTPGSGLQIGHDGVRSTRPQRELSRFADLTRRIQT